MRKKEVRDAIDHLRAKPSDMDRCDKYMQSHA